MRLDRLTRTVWALGRRANFLLHPVQAGRQIPAESWTCSVRQEMWSPASTCSATSAGRWRLMTGCQLRAIAGSSQAQ